MRKTRRTTADLVQVRKSCKRQKIAHHAQRKFASAYPASPSQRESNQESKKIPPKAEDFVEFLCMRNSPGLPRKLEVFAEPLVTPMSYSDDENFGDINEKDTIESHNMEESNVAKEDYSNKLNNLNEENIPSPEENGKHDSKVKNKKASDDLDGIVLEMANADKSRVKTSEMKDFSKLISKFKQKNIICICPSDDWVTPQYVQDDLKFHVTTKHVHRSILCLPENYLTLLCIKRQLEKETDTRLTEIPKMGFCEIDFALLWETVNMFGGLEAVHSDQNWKGIADHLNIPKTAARRVSKLENIYLKYVLPYDLLPEKEKNCLREKVKHDKNVEQLIPNEHVSAKPVSLVTFHKIACNVGGMYGNEQWSTDEVESNFWELLGNGNKHIAVVSGMIDLYPTPYSYQRSKKKAVWSLQNLFTTGGSVLGYLGKVSGISVPTLYVDSLFSNSDWKVEPHGFHTISYMHSGSNKIWYVVPANCKDVFKKLKSNRNRMMVTPNDLLRHQCPVIRCVQKEGEYIVVQPDCYYCSLSTGYSCSEMVCFASLDWFKSSFIKTYKYSLSNYVEAKVILSLAAEESKKTTRSAYSAVLIEKLNMIKTCLMKNLKVLNDHGVDDMTYLKLKTSTVRTCSVCNCNCYLLTVSSEKDADVLFCVDDAVKKVMKRKLIVDELIIECVVSVDMIETFVKKLQSQPADKKK